MIAAFRKSLTSLLPTSEDALERHLHGMQKRDWLPLAELFAARLPEFDVIIALPESQEMAEQVARIRGVPLVMAQPSPEGPVIEGNGTAGEALLLTTQLKSGEPEMDVANQAAAQGMRVTVLGAAVERTSLGGRNRLTQADITVRAALQIADTPQGLTSERRAPDRWSISA